MLTPWLFFSGTSSIFTVSFFFSSFLTRLVGGRITAVPLFQDLKSQGMSNSQSSVSFFRSFGLPNPQPLILASTN